jgi:MFS transporter, SP family, general alpha glucoside:H+ symporter
MESFDMFLNGNFVAIPWFIKEYGVLIDETDPSKGKAIETKWQSALFQAGQCGAFVGVLIAGPITNRLGYKWTTMLGLVLMNATIFISFFVSCMVREANPLC